VLCSLKNSNEPDEFKQMERLQELTKVAIPKNLQGLQEKKERHTGVIEKDQMLSFVANL
jgi:threonine synthase